jgi:hypothetical protein
LVHRCHRFLARFAKNNRAATVGYSFTRYKGFAYEGKSASGAIREPSASRQGWQAYGVAIATAITRESISR